MSRFIRVYRTVSHCCIVFNFHQRSGANLNWKWSQTFIHGSNIRLTSRDVTVLKIQGYEAASPVCEKSPFSLSLLTPSWLNMKTKQIKSQGETSISSKKGKHKHKKRKKSKRKSKVKAKLSMAVAESRILKDDSSSDSDVLVVYEAKRPSRSSCKFQVEEIFLDDDDSNSSLMNPVSLGDIPLPEGSSNTQDLALIPLPQEEHLSNSVQNHFTTYINVQESIGIAKLNNGIKDQSREHIAENLLRNDCDHESEVDAQNDSVHQIRSWENTSFGHQLQLSGAPSGGTIFSVMSYNVLAQRLLEDHAFLYRCHDKRSLTWDHRSLTLINEFRAANADVLCLQEVQFDHLEWFNDQLADLGYIGLFKRRTHNHVDGCAIYFKRDRFRLLESSSVEYYQPGVSVLDRDNVGLIARFEVVGSDQQLVVATTHLLFNPRRHDVKLAQMQLLLAELERIAYYRYDRSSQKAVYRPVIITGDFNLQPTSAVYRFITDGFIDYSRLSARTLSEPTNFDYVQQSLLPPDLQVSNTCQHLGILQQRQNWRHETLEGLLNELRQLKPYNSDNAAYIRQYSRVLPKGTFKRQERPEHNIVPNLNGKAEAQGATSHTTFDGQTVGMEPGMLSHSFHLKSVYRHFKRIHSSARPSKEATTHQQAWVTVDYIFYSGVWNQNQQATVEGPLKLLSRFCLPTEEQCQERLKHIPNKACGSDHLPLLARFLLSS